MRGSKRSEFPILGGSVACAAIWFVVTGIVRAEEAPDSTKSRTGLNVSSVIGSSEPFFEQWIKVVSVYMVPFQSPWMAQS